MVYCHGCRLHRKYDETPNCPGCDEQLVIFEEVHAEWLRLSKLPDRNHENDLNWVLQSSRMIDWQKKRMVEDQEHLRNRTGQYAKWIGN